MRRLLSMVFAPLFAAAGVVFALQALRATGDAGPSALFCSVLAVVCFALAAVTIAELYALSRRRQTRP